MEQETGHRAARAVPAVHRAVDAARLDRREQHAEGAHDAMDPRKLHRTGHLDLRLDDRSGAGSRQEPVRLVPAVHARAASDAHGVRPRPAAPNEMSVKILLIVVVLLGITTALAATNPTTAEYESFLDAQLMTALQRMDQ